MCFITDWSKHEEVLECQSVVRLNFAHKMMTSYIQPSLQKHNTQTKQKNTESCAVSWLEKSSKYGRWDSINSKNASKIQKALFNVQQVSLWENPFNISQLYFGKEKNKKIEKK